MYVFPLLPAGDTVSTLMSGSNLVVMIAPQILRCSKKNMGEKRACNKGQRMMFTKVTKKETASLHNYIKYTRLSGILFALSTDLAYSSLE